jgi:chromosome segregation protein
MRLKRLELFGFKSFAERMVLDFSAPVIGIVGPNGCGKSNVVDAVRWVLGEQRPTSMRGGEMTDVIFKGSASRPALNVAEVTLVLDNSEGALEGRGSEVAVTRRVYRGGEGEYLIDGRTVRLKDVREMLYGTGLGSRGYSVLEQGKIDAILSANALERRAIFEEAAGISRYRARKKETESKLERVQADCLRLDDVLSELERRRRSLRLQAGRAQRFLEARAAWQAQGQRLARHQNAALSAGLVELSLRLAREEEGVQALRARRAAAEQAGEARSAEQESLLAAIERCSAESAEAGAELRALDDRRGQLAERAEDARRAGRVEEERAHGLERRLALRREEACALEQRAGELERDLAAADERLRLLAGERAALEQDLARLARAQEEQGGSVLRLLHKKTSDQGELEARERARSLLAERVERAAARCRELSGQVEGLRAEEGERARELELLASQLLELERARSSAQGVVQGLESARASLEGRRNALEVEIARLSSRAEALRDWEEERAGLESGARELFRARERGEGPELSGELAGLLADHLHPDSRDSRALDAALGARAQALVARSREDALAIIAWLKGRASGRVSLLLPHGLGDEMGGADPHGHGASAPGAGSEGVLGPLAERARAEPAFERLARGLLADVLLVRDLESALALASRYPGWRFVTPEGDLVDACGVSGGHQEVTHGPLGRRSCAAELDEERRTEEAELARLDRELGELGASHDEEQERLRELGVSLERTLERRARLHSSLVALRARLEELEHALHLATAEQRERLDEGRRLAAEEEELRQRLAGDERALARERAALEAFERERAAAEAERDQRQRDEGHARVEHKGLVERLEAHRRELLQRGAADEEARVEIQRARRLAAEHAASAEQARATAGDLLLQRDALLARRGELETELVDLRAREKDGRRALETLRVEREALTAELERALGALGEERLEAQRLELSRAEILRRAREDFGLEPEAMEEGFEPEPGLADAPALEALAAEVRALRQSLEEVGSVNLEAVAELAEVEERHGFLDAQRRDLEESRRSLEDTVRALNEESERLFLHSFGEIREHFRAIFRQLFGGGRADVTLAEGQGVLEAGIEITARPPGREALPISLLSGGQRTMTALAILFAVFRAHPSPFCILDEVDAALDDANIGRFLALLQASLDETQFVVVTHNKGTMAACNLLYGVTMAVRGVSHVVSVELSRLDEIIPEKRRAPEAAPAPAPDAPDAQGGGQGGAPAELVTAEP